MAKDSKEKKDKKHFFKDFKAELKKVIWPTPKQVANNTVAVITIVIITAVIVFALDFIFEAINTYGIDNIRALVRNNTETVQEVSENEDGSNLEENSNEESEENNVEENDEPNEEQTTTETGDSQE